MSDLEQRLGLVVGGKYRVEEVLGAGGMGAVYSGVDEELGGAVAVKFLHRVYGRDPSLRARFRREAQALSRLRHPGIVSLLQFGEHDEELFVVMELVTGKPLCHLIDDGAVLSIPFVVTIFAELLAVLEFAHEQGVVHRDVKPSNVMILPGDRVKLIDFGLVRLPESQEKLTTAGIAHGTPEYMSPEQTQGEEAEAASDIYSAGVLLYECIAGEGPFDGGSAMLMTQHLFVEPPLLKTRGHKRDVPTALESIVRRALAKKAHERPTAAAMRAELLAFLKGTDAVSLTERGVEARQRDAALDREERALTDRPRAAALGTSAEGHVSVQVRDPARAAAIRSALGASGIASAAEGSDLAPTIAALVVSAADGPEIARPRPDVPVLVIDVDGTEATVRAIRAGASDVALKGTSDSKVAAQVARLLRRKR